MPNLLSRDPLYHVRAVVSSAWSLGERTNAVGEISQRPALSHQASREFLLVSF
ncbi:MAG: hypothetical protein ACFB4I_13510 [Cyanophyceae cyanobacterium]